MADPEGRRVPEPSKPSRKPTTSRKRRPPDPLDLAVGAAEAAAAVVCGLVMLGVGFSVVTRSFFNQPLAWVIELSGAAMLYITFLATAYVAKRDEHVRLDILDEFLPKPIIRHLDVLADLVQLALAASLTLISLRMVVSDIGRGTLSGGFLYIPRWWIGIIIPIGSFLLTLQLTRILVRRLRGRPAVEEAPRPGVAAFEAEPIIPPDRKP